MNQYEEIQEEQESVDFMNQHDDDIMVKKLPMVIYACPNRRCVSFGSEFKAMHFEQARFLTGRTIHCTSCGQVASFIRNATDEDEFHCKHCSFVGLPSKKAVHMKLRHPEVI